MSYIAVSRPTSIRDSASSASTTASDVPTPTANARASARRLSCASASEVSSDACCSTADR